MGTIESKNERTVNIRYSKRKSIEKKYILVLLYRELNDLDIALGGDPQCIETQRKREQVTLKLELLEQHKAGAVQVRARAKWVEKGEKNTSLFFSFFPSFFLLFFFFF